MRKRTEREIQRQRHWQEIVRGQRESGQSVRAYCRQAGMEESAFYWWRRELARRSRQRNDSPQPRRGVRQGEPTRPGRRRPSNAVAEVAFLPVQVAAYFASRRASTVRRCWTYSVCWRGEDAESVRVGADLLLHAAD
jgi:transposase-like protein